MDNKNKNNLIKYRKIMFYLLKQYICFYFILFNSIFISQSKTFNCHLPKECRIESEADYGFFYKTNSFLLCDIKNEAFEFKFKEPTPLITAGEKCFLGNDSLNAIAFQWLSNDLIILENRLNLTNVIRYFDNFEIPYFSVGLYYLKGFDVNFLGENYSTKR